MVQGKWFPQGSDISLPLSLRQAIFALGRDALDDMAQQVVVYEDQMPVGTARLWWAEGAFHLGDVGVLEAKRGKGFGDLLLRLLLFKALSHHAACVVAYAPRGVAPFFARFGFVPEQGEPTPDKDAPLRMVLAAEDIALSQCGSACGKGCEGCKQGQ